MTSQDKAANTYLRITSHAPYSEMNGIPREWFEKKIAEALDDWAIEIIGWCAQWRIDFSAHDVKEDTPKLLYEEFLKESALK